MIYSCLNKENKEKVSKADNWWFNWNNWGWSCIFKTKTEMDGTLNKHLGRKTEKLVCHNALWYKPVRLDSPWCYTSARRITKGAGNYTIGWDMTDIPDLLGWINCILTDRRSQRWKCVKCFGIYQTRIRHDNTEKVFLLQVTGYILRKYHNSS